MPARYRITGEQFALVKQASGRRCKKLRKQARLVDDTTEARISQATATIVVECEMLFSLPAAIV
jgi:hypothetical protein